jgi:hypothetical protein
MPVAAAKITSGPSRGPSRSATSSSSSQDSNGRFGASPLRVLDALLGRVDVEHLPHDRPGEHLPQRLRRLEPVTGRDRHPPGGDLDRAKLVEPVVAKDDDRARKQEAKLLERHRRGLVLGQVLLDELGKGERPREPLLAPPFLERPLQRSPRVLLTRKATMLHPLPASSPDPVAVRPQRRAICTGRRQPEHLTLLPHHKPPRLTVEPRNHTAPRANPMTTPLKAAWSLFEAISQPSTKGPRAFRAAHCSGLESR